MEDATVEITTRHNPRYVAVQFCYSEKGKKPVLEGGLKDLKERLEEQSFSGKLSETTFLGDRVVVGLGEKEKLLGRNMRTAAVSAVGLVQALKIKEIEIDATSLGQIHIKNLVYALKVKLHKSGDFKSKKGDDEKEKGGLKHVSVLVNEKDVNIANDALMIAESVNYARDIANNPANIATPKFMADKARELAKKHKLGFRLLAKEDMRKMGMNALLAVSSGSAQEPMLPIIEYKAKGAKKTIAVIGKGLTFDSGGISLKPSKGMEEMKFDKSGACAVLGVMKAVAELRPKVNVIGLLPSTENMPGGRAAKPGDIVKAYNGKTIEIDNTDAEGRLVLADVLAYADDKYKPDYIIDMATLTGACVVALGNICSGLLGNDDAFNKLVKNASLDSFDEVWELPLWPEYGELMKGKYADLRNISGTGEAGTITGAMFLSNFVAKAKWVHLDIAGTAYRPRPIPPIEFGASGAGVSICIETIKLLEKD